MPFSDYCKGCMKTILSGSPPDEGTKNDKEINAADLIRRKRAIIAEALAKAEVTCSEEDDDE